MKNKGFTLVELLAVIVILSIVLVVAIPRISNVIETSKLNSAKASSKNLLNRINEYYIKKL